MKEHAGVLSIAVPAVISLAVMAVSSGFTALNINSQRQNAALAVEPRVNIRMHSVSVDATAEHGPATRLTWTLNNAGLGPAIIGASDLYVRRTGKFFPLNENAAWYELKNELAFQYKAKLDVTSDTHEPIEPGYAIKAGGEVTLFELSIKGLPSEVVEGGFDAVGIALCYCSLHGDCLYEDTKREQTHLIVCPEKVDMKNPPWKE